MLPMVIPAWVAAPPVGPPHRRYVEDFEQAFQWLKSRYAWADQMDWKALAASFRPQIKAAGDDRAFHRILENFLEAFADAHTHLGSNHADSWRLPPGDLAAEWREGRAVVLAVRPGSRAAQAGVQAGMTLLEVDGHPLAQGLEEKSLRFIREPRESHRHWQLNAFLAGRHQAPRTFRVEAAGSRLLLSLPQGPDPASPQPETRLLSQDVGLIAFPDLGSPNQLDRFAAARKQFPTARAWIFDLRHNTGGDTEVMKPLLGQFLSRTTPYARMRRRAGSGLGPSWEERIQPVAPRFDGPLAVLVSPWTESVAESLAMAVQQSGRGKVFGTRMAGLDAAVQSLRLHHSGLRVQASVEPIYDLNHHPRSAFRPKGLVDLSTNSSGDAVLDAAVHWIEQCLESKKP